MYLATLPDDAPSGILWGHLWTTDGEGGYGRLAWQAHQRAAGARHGASYSSWRRHHMPVSLRPSGARSSHWYMPHTPSSPRSYAE